MLQGMEHHRRGTKESVAGQGKRATGRRIDMQPLAMNAKHQTLQRMVTGVAEFDRVSGSGHRHGSASLIGGDPGIGKSTLLLQLVCQLARAGVRTAYISGEESADQVRMQAERLGLCGAEVELATLTNANAASIGGTDGPAVIVID